MCLHISVVRHSNHLTPIIMAEDRIVYKVLSKTNRSPMLEFLYHPLHTYHTELDVYEKYAIVDDGFHAFTTYEAARQYAIDSVGEKVVEFTIPKGSTVFFGTENDIVSNTIAAGDLTEVSKGDLLCA